MQDVYENIEEHNLCKKRKVLIVFDDMIPDMINNKKLTPVVTELFISGRKLNISIVFTTQSSFKVPREVRLNTTQKQLQQIHLNHSSDIYFNKFMKIYQKSTTEPYYFLFNDTTLPSDNPLSFRKNLLE